MLALIVAYAKNRIIGNKGVIPWTLSNEKKRFRELTTENIVVMGRRTYEEIGRPLPNRFTIVISSTKNFQEENCITLNSVEEAINYCRINLPDKDIFISGGAEIYKAVLPYVEKMYVTEIDADIKGDTYFPDFCEEDFRKDVEAEIHEELTYRYITYTRKP